MQCQLQDTLLSSGIFCIYPKDYCLRPAYADKLGGTDISRAGQGPLTVYDSGYSGANSAARMMCQ